jgi:hypothetical protein
MSSMATIDTIEKNIEKSVETNVEASMKSSASGFSVQFVFQRDNLLQAVSSVSRATQNKPIQPILSHILLEVDPLEQRVTLSATDMDLSIRTWVSLDDEATESWRAA